MTRTVLIGRLGTLWQRGVVEPSAVQVLLALAVLLGADHVYDAIGATLGGGVFDELAHAATALLCLGLVPARWRRPILAPALIGSVLIDADHIPQYLFGDDALTVGTPRPYTHALWTIALLLVLALAWRGRRGRAVWLGLAVGISLHFVRDLAEGGGAGVSLLWPLGDHVFAYRHSAYLVLMAGVAVVDLLLLARRRQALSAVLAAGALLVALLLGGCGSGAVRGGSSANSASVAGLFHQDCQLCHSLSGPASRSQQGGSLADLTITPAQTAAQIAEMPRLHGPLSPRQVSELTRYVLAVNRR